jgi:glycosyltransferase involved in cell wall biosynthesis
MSSDSETPLVSIVTCYLDAAPHIQEMIESVLDQDYPDIELLLVDDGSTDGGVDVAHSYARRDSRVRLLAHEGNENRGKSSSRNLGIAHASGELLVFLDADDVLLPGKLTQQTAALRANQQVDIVVGSTLYWHSESDAGAKDVCVAVGLPPGIYPPPALMTHFLRHRGSVSCLCSPMVRIELVRRVGGFDESIQQLFEDQVLLAKIFLSGTTLVSNFCGEKYRQHAHSSSQVAARNGEYHPWRLNRSEQHYYQWLNKYVRESGVNERKLLAALDHAQRKYRYPRTYTAIRALRHAIKRMSAGKSGRKA